MKLPRPQPRRTQTRPVQMPQPPGGASAQSLDDTQPALPDPAALPSAPQPQQPPPSAYPPPGPASPLPTYRRPAPPRRRVIVRRARRSPARPRLGCLIVLGVCLAVLAPAAFYLFAPVRTNIMLIGVDYVDPSSVHAIGRTDTIILASVLPPRPYIGMLSIPRDLWVSIPGVGENRINTAHFYAESAEPGSGPQLLRRTIALNFGVDLPYYLRIRFEGFRDIVDALGGVDIVLEEAAAGYPPGRHHLTGRKALAFVRDRADSDDFFRMAHGQLMIRALMRNLLNPFKWPRLPAVTAAVVRSVDTNLPVWLWPRLGVAVLRLGPAGIDSKIIRREMTTPFVTNEGAQVLAPKWDLILPLIDEIFGR